MDCKPTHTPLSMGFSRPEYWSGLLFPSPGDLPPTQGWNPGLLRCRRILYELNHQCVCVCGGGWFPGGSVGEDPVHQVNN